MIKTLNTFSLQKLWRELNTELNNRFLGEINDPATRWMVTNFIRDCVVDKISYDINFHVLCNETNNPLSVVVNNELRARVIFHDNFMSMSFCISPQTQTFAEALGEPWLFEAP